MTYIYISSNRVDLDLAWSVRARLQNEGLETWLDDTVASDGLQDVFMLTAYVIGTTDAVLAIGTGMSDELEVAQQLGKPIYYLGPNTDLSRLIEQLKAVRKASETTPLKPEPLDEVTSQALQRTVRRSRLPLGLLVFGAVIVALIALSLTINSRTRGDELTLTVGAVALTSAQNSTATQVALLEEISTPPPLDTATTGSTEIPTQTESPVTLPSPTSAQTEALLFARTITASPTPAATLTPMPTDTSTATTTFTASPTQSPTATLTAFPTLTPMPIPTQAAPLFDATVIPGGADNTLWTPIEREINGLTMVYVPAGCFTMIGVDTGVALMCVDPFWISKTEITNAEYGTCVKSGECAPPTNSSSRTWQDYFGSSSFANFPVINVTWQQARDFSQWVGGDLPSEVQWRYAAQGPSAWLYPWGNEEPNPTLLNYDGGVGDVTEVGAYPNGASWVGALDLSGNVWEWTATPADQTNKVVYGGSWNSYVGLVSAVSRAVNPETDSSFYTGFRVVIAPAQ